MAAGITNKQALDNIVAQYDDIEVAQGFAHPNFDPIAIHLGPLELRWYSLAYLFGIILGWMYINYINRKYGRNYLTVDAREALPVWMILSIVIGGRLGYVLFYNFGYYMNNLGEMYKIWKGGMSFHGGLTGVILGTILFARYYKLQFFRISDMLAVATPIGLFFGRLANFINKELVGRKMESGSWGIIYPNETFARYPSQLMEAAMEGVLLFIILFVAVRCRLLERKGAISGLFLILYGTFRVFLEIFRQPDQQIGYIYNSVSLGQLLCVPMILAGVAILLFSKRIEETK